MNATAQEYELTWVLTNQNQYGGNFGNFTSSDIRTRDGNDTLDTLEPTQTVVDDDDEEWD